MVFIATKLFPYKNKDRSEDMNFRKLRKVLLAMLFSLFILGVPQLPAWGIPGLPQFQTIGNNYQGPAAAEVKELSAFITPLMNEMAIATLDFTRLIAAKNPDQFIQQYEQIQPVVEADPTCSQELKNKLRAALNDARARKNSGKTIDDAAFKAQVESAMPQLLSRMQSINERMYSGMRPRLMKIADKDPDFAMKMCDMMQHNTTMLKNSANVSTANLSDADRRLMNMPNEVRKYAQQVKAKRGQ